MTELAARIGVDQSNLSKSLDGNPTLSRLEDIARVLGVPVRELLPDAPPASPAGVLDMGGRRFALVPLPDDAAEDAEARLEAPKLTPGELQEKICNMARLCAKDGRTRAVFGFLEGHMAVVLFDGESKRYLWLFWEDDGAVTHLDYPLHGFDDEADDDVEWDEEQLAELMVNDILGSHVL